MPTERDGFGNVIGRVPGRGDRAMLLNAHLDVMQPCRGIKPVVKGDTVWSDGTTILGADDRAGVAVILEVIETLRDRPGEHVPLEIVFTLGEEAGLLAPRHSITSA